MNARSERFRQLTLPAMLLALALVLGWIEHMLPALSSVPGIKLGLSNVPVLFALYACGRRPALLIAVGKVVLSCALFGGFSAFLYSAAGMTAAFIAMAVLCQQHYVSPVGTSAAGGAVHVAAQTGVAMLLTGTPSLWRLLPLMLAAGTLSGVLTGVIVLLVLKRLDGHFQ